MISILEENWNCFIYHCNRANPTLGGIWQLVKDDAIQPEIGSERNSNSCTSKGNTDRKNISLQMGRHPRSLLLRHSILYPTKWQWLIPPSVTRHLCQGPDSSTYHTDALVEQYPFCSTEAFAWTSPTLSTNLTPSVWLHNNSSIKNLFASPLHELISKKLGSKHDKRRCSLQSCFELLPTTGFHTHCLQSHRRLCI